VRLLLAPERRMMETVPEVVGFQVRSKVLPAVMPLKLELVKLLPSARANRGEAIRAMRV